MKCSHCKKEIQEGSKYCPYCGQKVEQVIKCPNCGNSIRQGDVFCMSCGCKVGSAESETQKPESVCKIHQTVANEVSNNSTTTQKAEEKSKTPLYVGIIACVAIVLAGLFYYLSNTGSNSNNPRIEIGNIQYKGSYELKNWSYDRGWKNYDVLSLNIEWPVSIKGVEPTQLQEQILHKIWDFPSAVDVKVLESSNINHILMNMYEKKMNYTPEFDYDKKIWTRGIEAKVTVLASTKKYITFEYDITPYEYETSDVFSHGYITYDIAKSECVEDRLINSNYFTEIAKYLLRNDEYYNLHPEEYNLEPDVFYGYFKILQIGLTEKGIICCLDGGLNFYELEECSLDQLREYVSDECVELLTDNEHCDYVVKDIGNIITY